jgi:hypothetical protein
MNKYIILVFAIAIFGTSCTIYTERESKELSKTVYATKDSLEQARIDLAVSYSEQAARIVKPPKLKDRVVIEPIYDKKSVTVPIVATSAAPKQELKINKQRILIVPEIYKNDTVIVVNSKEYQQLLKDKQVFKQLQNDFDKLKKVKDEVDAKLSQEELMRNKMVEDLNKMQKQLLQKDLAIIKRNIIITILVLSIGAGVYLRMKGVL